MALDCLEGLQLEFNNRLWHYCVNGVLYRDISCDNSNLYSFRRIFTPDVHVIVPNISVPRRSNRAPLSKKRLGDYENFSGKESS